MNPRRILLVTPCSPFSPRSGAEQRTGLLYDALTKLGKTDVLIVAPTIGFSQAKRSEDSRILSQLFWKELPLGVGKYIPDKSFSKELSALDVSFNAYDLIVGRYLNPICKLELPKDIPTIVDLDDWGKTFRKESQYSIKAAVVQLKQHYANWLAKNQLKRFDGFFFVSKRDLDKERELLSTVLPNIPFSAPFQPLPETDKKNILFIGALWYGPNAEGINHFLECCWPKVRAAVPDATLTLVGEASPEIRKKWSVKPGVTANGFVERIQDAYLSASFSIAPIYYGGGTNIKILESLAFGRACITTPHSAEAFKGDLVAGGGLSVAKDDLEFSDICIAMLTDGEARKRSALLGYKVVKDHYNKETFTNSVISFSEEVLVKKYGATS